jgi:dUTP pyrophosphatase
MNIKLLSENATIPTYAHEGDAGMDLYSAIDAVIPYGETVKIPTDVAMEIPTGFVGLIYPRSGLATKQGLRLANCVGVVDSGYRGNVIVALYNDSKQPQEIHKGDRIAQMVIQPFVSLSLNVVDELENTERGEGGFGSSGSR